MGFWFAYFLGAATFLPALCGLVFALAYLTFPTVLHDEPAEDHAIRLPADDDKVFAAAEEVARLKRKNSQEKDQQAPQDVAAGFFAVTREYVPGGVNGKPPERPTPNGNLPTESPSVYQTMYRSLFERKPAATSSVSTNVKGKNVFFVVLRHGHLMLYDDEEQVEVRHVISLAHHTVSIYGGEGEVIPEGELYIRRNAIRLCRRPSSSSRASSLSKPFFLFSENCSDKEDFYFALVKNQEREESKDGQVSPSKPLGFETRHIISLVQRLHSSEEDLQTRWLNGLVGRLFLALYKTAEVEDHIRSKITKKIARVKRPAFLSNIIVEKIDCGDGAPFITNPKMREMTADGEFSAEADIKYAGNFRIEISTVATLSLGNRFKPRQVPLVLAAVFKRLEGHAVLRIKPAPSNRLWFSFVELPKMDISVEPIVSSRQITWNMILKPIENRIKEVIAETMVSPHWDDIPFIPTDDQPLRGGLWESMRADSTKSSDPVASGSVEDAEKQDKMHEDAETLASLSEQEKSMSMPVLPEPVEVKASTKPRRSVSIASSPPGISEDKAVSSSVESVPQPVHRTHKSRRSASIGTPISSSPPVVATTTINANAERQDPKYDNDRSDAVSFAMSITRSRSSSGGEPAESGGGSGTSPFQTPYGSPNLSFNNGQGFSPSPSVTAVDTSSVQTSADSRSVRSSAASWRSTATGSTLGSGNTADSLKSKLGTLKSNLSGMSFAKSFNPNNMGMGGTQHGSSGESTPSAPGSNLDKTPFATTLASAGVAVKKWYINSRKRDEGPLGGGGNGSGSVIPESGFHPVSEMEHADSLRDAAADANLKPYPNEGPPRMADTELKERIRGFGINTAGDGLVASASGAGNGLKDGRSRAVSSPGSGTSSSGSRNEGEKQHKYPVPPWEIPPPVPPPAAKRTNPIDVPKRRALPPPLLPPRASLQPQSQSQSQSQLQVLPPQQPPPPPPQPQPQPQLQPPVQQPNGSARHSPARKDEPEHMMVVAAPIGDSEPVTPSADPDEDIQLPYLGGSSPEAERKGSPASSKDDTPKPLEPKDKNPEKEPVAKQRDTRALELPDFESEAVRRHSGSSNASVRSGGSGRSGKSSGSESRWEARERIVGRRTAVDPDEAPRSWTSEEEWRWRKGLMSEITGEEG
ncbi:hypothetical protein Dda_0282 [Drechslerella dactyloides]|uniref:SMP-LTD domain-containing protein n=1 Tax=Drechslerella dactyloides TaxID=74499 RepID=A0AAD6J4N4_DREDA|nr:hypothetical protein Dda_0282 [Drechslerella dactyloides]